MKQFLLAILCVSMMHSYAQKTITKRTYTGKLYEQYQVDANGTYHGFYKKFFDNGFLETDAVYYKGTQTSSKTYEYHGKTRYLMHNATWDRKGKILTSWNRMVDYSTGNIGALKQTAGILANGKGRWSIDNDYTELYNNNDTTYVWDDKTKASKVRKFVKGNRIFSKEETSINIKLAERHSMKEDRASYDKRNVSDSVLKLANTYHIKLEQAYAGDETKFYTTLVQTLRSTIDNKLRNMIIDAFDFNEIDKPENLEYSLLDLRNGNAELQVSGDVTYVVLHTCKDKFKSRNYSGYNDESPITEMKLVEIIDYMNKNSK